MACPESGKASISGCSPQDLLDTLNELLEAERAGARVTFLTAAHAPESAKVLIHAIHHDEARWCDMLVRAVRRLQGAPSQTTGAFCAKAMAIEDLPSRLAYLNRGQQWVIRKLQMLLPTVSDVALRADLAAMLASHQANVRRVTAHLTAEASHPAGPSCE
jgi:nitronate monooxygenase